MGEIDNDTNSAFTNRAIAIPIYKEQPSKEEMLSFAQCLRVFKKREIYIICQKGLNIKKYLEAVDEESIIKFKYYDARFFLNVQGYNALLLSEEFYFSFNDYEYILIYQLDAYVFSDQLDYWCNKGFDYVGAPWFENYHLNTNYKFYGVGNGGFSLRKVSTLKLLTGNWQDYFSVRFIYHSHSLRLKSKLLLIESKLKKLINMNVRNLGEYVLENEDYIFGHVFGNELKLLKIPDCIEASQFAFEVHPDYLFELNHGNLPFGCHGWYRYNTLFWKDLIK